jgi:hypothetical protein
MISLSFYQKGRYNKEKGPKADEHENMVDHPIKTSRKSCDNKANKYILI